MLRDLTHCVEYCLVVIGDQLVAVRTCRPETRFQALERVAHFLLELLRRLKIIGLADERSFRLPLTQELIADARHLAAEQAGELIESMESPHPAV